MTEIDSDRNMVPSCCQKHLTLLTRFKPKNLLTEDKCSSGEKNNFKRNFLSCYTVAISFYHTWHKSWVSSDEST